MIRTITEWIFPAKKAARLAKEDDYKIALAKVEAARRARPQATLTAKNAVMRERHLHQVSIGSRTTAPVDSPVDSGAVNAYLFSMAETGRSARTEEPAPIVSGGGSFDGAGASADWSSCSSSSDSSSSYSSDSSSSDSSSSCSSGD